jgi:hypothetical protein
MGSVHNSLRSDKDTSFSIFCLAQPAAQKRKTDQRQRQNRLCNDCANKENSVGNDNVFEVVFEVVLDVDLNPLGTQPFVCCRKWIRKVRCLSRRRVSDFSHFLQHTNGNPKGKSAVAFFCLRFLGETRKVSSRRSTTGQRSQTNVIHNSTTTTRQAHHAASMRLLAACRQDPHKQCVSGHHPGKISSVSRFTQLIPIHLTRHQHDRR